MSFNHPIYGVQYVLYDGLLSQANAGKFQSNPTLAAGDVKVSKDGGSLANITTLPTVVPTSSKQVKITISATEMQADVVSVIFSDATGDEWYDHRIDIHTHRLPYATVDDPTPSSTSFGTSLTESTDDHYNNLYLYFLDGPNAGVSRKISDYDGLTNDITLATALPEDPTDGDKFLILGRSE